FLTISSSSPSHHTAPTDIYTLSLHDALPIVLLDLAGGGLRQLEEDHVLGHLEPGQMLAAEAHDVLLADPLAGLEGDEGAGCFAPLVIRLGDHCGLQYRRVPVEHALDLDGGDVLATGVAYVLEAVLDLHVPVLVPHALVAGMEPAALEGFGGGGRVLQVALHHGVAAHEDLADGL